MYSQLSISSSAFDRTQCPSDARNFGGNFFRKSFSSLFAVSPRAAFRPAARSRIRCTTSIGREKLIRYPFSLNTRSGIASSSFRGRGFGNRDSSRTETWTGNFRLHGSAAFTTLGPHLLRFGSPPTLYLP